MLYLNLHHGVINSKKHFNFMQSSLSNARLNACDTRILFIKFLSVSVSSNIPVVFSSVTFGVLCPMLRSLELKFLQGER